MAETRYTFRTVRIRETSAGRIAGGMPLFYGRLLRLLLHHVLHEAVPEVDREAREDDPFDRVEDVQQVEAHLLRRRRGVDRLETVRRVVEDEVSAVGGDRIRPDIDQIGHGDGVAFALFEIGIARDLAGEV